MTGSPPPVESLLDALRARGCAPTATGDSRWTARCPAHDDHRPSLSIGVGERGAPLWFCHAGCGQEAVLTALGLSFADVMPRDLRVRSSRGRDRPDGAACSPQRRTVKPPPRTFKSADEAIASLERGHGPRAGHWSYQDATGATVGHVLRFDTPEGKQVWPVSGAGDRWGASGMPAPRPPYGLGELLAAQPGTRVYVAEGEKCTEAARSVGLVATTSAHGCGSAHLTDWSALEDQDVVIMPDRDDSGEKYAAEVAALAVAAGARSVRVLRLWHAWPEMPRGGDIADYLDGPMDSREPEAIRQGIEALADAAPLFEPGPGSAGDLVRPRIVTARALLRAHPCLRRPIIHGLLRERETMNLIAPSKRGKSWLVVAISLSIATGRSIFDRFGVETGEVLILDNELHPETIAQRLPRVATAMRLAPEAWVDRVHVDSLRSRLVDLQRMEIEYFSRIEPGRFTLIVLDAFYRFLPEGVDENDNGAIAGLYNVLDRIAGRLDCAFVLIHHTSKGAQWDKSVTDVGAGAGAQSRAADAHVILREHQEDGAVVLEASVRSWPPTEPLCLRWEFPLWVRDPGLDPAQLRTGLRRPRANADQHAGGRPPSEPWTPARFAAAFAGEAPADQKLVLARAKQAGMSGSAARDQLTLALGEKLLHVWRYEGDQRVYIASREQPLTATSSSRTDPPPPLARPPIPPRPGPKAGRGGGKARKQRVHPQGKPHG